MASISPSSPAPQLLTRAEAAATLRVHERTLREWVRRGYLPAIRLPSGAIRIDASEIEALIEAGKHEAAAEADRETD